MPINIKTRCIICTLYKYAENLQKRALKIQKRYLQIITQALTHVLKKIVKEVATSLF